VRSATLALASLAVAAACGTAGPLTIEDAERGCRYVVPAGWIALDGELRSPQSSLLTLRVFDLADADREFLAGLPESIVPRLEEWARTYYIVDGEPGRAETTVGGIAALELAYSARVRAGDPVTKVLYWVVRPGQRLFVLRAVLPARAIVQDEPALRAMLASWVFLDSAIGSAALRRPAQGCVRASRCTCST
jgi:hypothetical protein